MGRKRAAASSVSGPASNLGIKQRSSARLRAAADNDIDATTNPDPVVSQELKLSKSEVDQLDKGADEARFYLMKNEPEECSFDDLEARPTKQEVYDGVRSFRARNVMRTMKIDDLCWFYHSSCKVPAIMGVCRVVREAAPDPKSLDPENPYYDAKSTADNNRWDNVVIQWHEKYDPIITLKELRAQAKVNPIIADMTLLRVSRLSVMHVTLEQWQEVLQLQKRKKEGDDLLQV